MPWKSAVSMQVAIQDGHRAYPPVLDRLRRSTVQELLDHLLMCLHLRGEKGHADQVLVVRDQPRDRLLLVVPRLDGATDDAVRAPLPETGNPLEVGIEAVVRFLRELGGEPAPQGLCIGLARCLAVQPLRPGDVRNHLQQEIFFLDELLNAEDTAYVP